MRRIAVTIQPFVLNQTIQIFEDDNLKEFHLAPLEAVDQIVAGMCKTYDITQVDIRGESHFTEKIKEKILTATKFEQLNVNIDLY